MLATKFSRIPLVSGAAAAGLPSMLLFLGFKQNLASLASAIVASPFNERRNNTDTWRHVPHEDIPVFYPVVCRLWRPNRRVSCQHSWSLWGQRLPLLSTPCYSACIGWRIQLAAGRTRAEPVEFACRKINCPWVLRRKPTVCTVALLFHSCLSVFAPLIYS